MNGDTMLGLLANGVHGRVVSLLNIGHTYYRLSDVAMAAEKFREALELAETERDSKLEVQCRRWCGAALYESGKLRESLSVLAPILSTGIRGDQEDTYVSMVKYVEIAQEVPVSLGAIQKGYLTIGQMLSALGSDRWRHMHLRKHSELCRLRGNFSEALALAQESWSIFKLDPGGPGFLPEEYLFNLVHIHLLLGNLEDASCVIEEWMSIESSVPSYKEVTLLIRQAELARCQGKFPEAIQLARRSLYLAEQTRHYWRYLCALHGLIRAFLSAGSIDNAEIFLRYLVQRRFAQSLHARYRQHLLRGDFFLAKARTLLGLSPTEYEFQNTTEGLFNTPSEQWSLDRESRLGLREGEKAEHMNREVAINITKILRHARQAYKTSATVGNTIDKRLATDIRRKEVGLRLAKIEMLSQEVWTC